MTRVDVLAPDAGAHVDLDGDALRGWLAGRYERPGQWVRLNLAATVDGRTAPAGGDSGVLAGGIDRMLLGVLRSQADVVLVGAGTARAERFPLPRAAPLAIATVSGDLDPAQLPAGASPERVLVLCPRDRADRTADRLRDAATVLPVDGDPVARPGLLLAALAHRGLSRVLCEGGGGIAGALLAGGLVDELAQTVVPALLSPGPSLTGGTVPLTSLALAGLLRDPTDRLYARWIPRR